MPRPRGHGPGYSVKREEIIEAAAKLFAKKGYAATGTIELGSRVGLAKPALYYYIKSKEQLLVEIQDRVLKPLRAVTDEIVAIDTDPVLRLRLVSEALLEIIFRRQEYILVYEHDYRQLKGRALKALLDQRHQFEQVITMLFRNAMRLEMFKPRDERLAMLQFLNLHNHTYQWLKPKGAWDAPFLSREFCATLFAGFASPGLDLTAIEARVQDYPSALERYRALNVGI